MCHESLAHKLRWGAGAGRHVTRPRSTPRVAVAGYLAEPCHIAPRGSVLSSAAGLSHLISEGTTMFHAVPLVLVDPSAGIECKLQLTGTVEFLEVPPTFSICLFRSTPPVEIWMMAG